MSLTLLVGAVIFQYIMDKWVLAHSLQCWKKLQFACAPCTLLSNFCRARTSGCHQFLSAVNNAYSARLTEEPRETKAKEVVISHWNKYLLKGLNYFTLRTEVNAFFHTWINTTYYQILIMSICIFSYFVVLKASEITRFYFHCYWIMAYILLIRKCSFHILNSTPFKFYVKSIIYF